MLDYYQLLEIPKDASSAQIKRAFRQQAKQHHPDLWQESPEAIAAMRDLIKAYETLMDPDLRVDYDILHRQVFGLEDGFDYRSFLLDRPDDDVSQAKLIFFDLLHKREKDALRLYETLVLRKGYELSAHLDREDFMDCAFLLAEEFEDEGNYESAFHLLETIVEYELREAYFRHFFEEVLQRLRSLVGSKMTGKLPAMAQAEYAEKMIRFRISNKESAFYFKVAAEQYCKVKDYARMDYYLKEAQRLDKSITGLKKIRSGLSRR